MAERSKALVLGTSLFGGVGSNPTAASKVLLQIVNELIEYNYMYFIFISILAVLVLFNHMYI